MALLQESNFASGDTITIPAHCIHSMGDADGDDPLTTQHFYRRAGSKMNIYDTINGISSLVTGDAGAWLSDSESRLLSKRSDLPSGSQF